MPTACRAATVITLAGEKAARGRAALEAPLRVEDNAVILAEDGVILGVEPFSAFRRRAAASFTFTDAGDVCLTPGLINAHCHLELSHTKGKCAGGKGFTLWLRSLVEVLRTRCATEETRAATAKALEDAVASGTAHIGDVGSRLPGMVSELAERLLAGLDRERGCRYPLTHFLELIGFTPPAPEAGIPEELRAGPWFLPASAALPPRRYADCALSGHSLYSTAPEALQAAHALCRRTGRIFSVHLAESLDEDECIRDGSGPLHALMAELLPAPTRAWGTSPAALAGKLGLLDPGTLAVHGVRLSSEDRLLLSRSGCSVCLCPRSNAFIASGRAWPTAPEADGILFCLGTDGLSSNTDVDMRKEAAAARDAYGLPARAVLRMATVNGAGALGRKDLGTLEAGKAAVVGVFHPDKVSFLP
ncbi:MAG: amidohydrolase family protein [Desulfovibrio sp.]|jgi:cytosine/adenosine deaminase-related metal-dependent hydrolase|nr:amidohydrolase family protein [Desulfovibrio sp.]